MPGWNWTANELLESVKRRAQLVANTRNLSDSDILALADDELLTYILPRLIGVSEEYAVTFTDISVVPGQRAYDIPQRAIGRELRDVLLLNSVGSSTGYIQLARIEPERDPVLLSGGNVAGYYFEGDQVILTPTPTYASTLRLKWFYRPNKLVTTSEAAVIQSINGARTVITTASTIPTTFGVGLLVDVVNHQPGFSTRATDYTTTATTSGTTITLTTALPSSVVAGNYVCLAQEAPVAQIPPDLYPLLAERVAFRCLQAVGDAKAESQREEAEKMEERTLRLITPRSKGSARRIVSRYGPGQTDFWYRFGWRGWR